MSRNEWESGEIKLSTKEFGAFRRDMIRSYNEQQTQLFNLSSELYGRLKAAGKGRRNFDFQQELQNMGQRIDSGSFHAIYDAIFPNKVVGAVGGQYQWRVSTKPSAPKKKSFAPLKQSATVIPVGEAGIGFKKETRLVVWQVSENNHAVERAREHKMGVAFFNRLGRVVWTRGTGGEIVGNDEYNQDSRENGGGGNYVTARYGVAEKQFRKAFAR